MLRRKLPQRFHMVRGELSSGIDDNTTATETLDESGSPVNSFVALRISDVVGLSNQLLARQIYILGDLDFKMDYVEWFCFVGLTAQRPNFDVPALSLIPPWEV